MRKRPIFTVYLEAREERSISADLGSHNVSVSGSRSSSPKCKDEEIAQKQRPEHKNRQPELL